MIRTAVILAAGSGTRMKLFQKPKGFLNIAGKCLIEYSIEALLDHGIERIVIGTGFKSEFYDELKDRYPQVVTQRNDYYATTGSLKTLVSLGDLIAGDFLLLESDVLYDASCLTAMIQDPHENVVLLSSTENQKDGVFVEVDRDYNLVRMTKEVHYLQKPEDGILVGITRLSARTFRQLLKIADRILNVNGLEHYDFAFEHLPAKFFVLRMDNLVFTEIDDNEQLSYALNCVYPKLTLAPRCGRARAARE